MNISDLPSDNPSESASAVADALTRNKASAKAVQGSGDGKPTVKRAAVKRSFNRGAGGKFTKKKPSDPVKKPQTPETTDNTEHKPQPSTDTVSDGGDGGFVRVPTDQPEQQRTGVSMGPEAGRVISDGIFGIFTKRGGGKWKPTEEEREMVGKAAAGATDGKHVPWWLALMLAVGFYAMARVGLDKAKKESGNNGTDKHGDNRSNPVGQNTVRQEDGWAFAKKF